MLIVMRFKSEVENLSQQIRYLNRVIIVGSVLMLIALVGWISAPKEMTLYYPPDLRNGATVKANEIPPEVVYSFAHYIFQHVQNWESNGASDYEDNRKRYRAFLTPTYQAFIRDDIENRKVDIVNRRRELHPIPGSSYETKSVSLVGPNSWIVWMDFHVKEFIRGTLVKDVYIRYPMKVVKYQVAREANPWQLALAGYVEEPIQLAKREG